MYPGMTRVEAPIVGGGYGGSPYPGFLGWGGPKFSSDNWKVMTKFMEEIRNENVDKGRIIATPNLFCGDHPTDTRYWQVSIVDKATGTTRPVPYVAIDMKSSSGVPEFVYLKNIPGSAGVTSASSQLPVRSARPILNGADATAAFNISHVLQNGEPHMDGLLRMKVSRNVYYGLMLDQLLKQEYDSIVATAATGSTSSPAATAPATTTASASDAADEDEEFDTDTYENQDKPISEWLQVLQLDEIMELFGDDAYIAAGSPTPGLNDKYTMKDGKLAPAA